MRSDSMSTVEIAVASEPTEVLRDSSSPTLQPRAEHQQVTDRSHGVMINGTSIRIGSRVRVCCLCHARFPFGGLSMPTDRAAGYTDGVRSREPGRGEYDARGVGECRIAQLARVDSNRSCEHPLPVVEHDGARSKDGAVGKVKLAPHGPARVRNVYVHEHPRRMPVVHHDLTHELARRRFEGRRSQGLTLRNLRCRLLNRLVSGLLGDRNGPTHERHGSSDPEQGRPASMPCPDADRLRLRCQSREFAVQRRDEGFVWRRVARAFGSKGNCGTRDLRILAISFETSGPFPGNEVVDVGVQASFGH